MDMQREVVVVSGVRTAIGDFGGGLKDVSPTDLGGQPTRLRLVRRAAASVLADDVDVRGAHGVASAGAGIPETLVGMPAVIASTTSCWVVFSRS